MFRQVDFDKETFDNLIGMCVRKPSMIPVGIVESYDFECGTFEDRAFLNLDSGERIFYGKIGRIGESIILTSY